MNPPNHPPGMMRPVLPGRMIGREMFLLLAIVLLIFVPWPWSLLAALLSCFAFVGEVAFWQRRIRSRKVQTGVENLVGAVGEVVEPLTPRGQIRVLGELWQAHSSSEVGRGTRVKVVAIDGLTLEVEPAMGPPASTE